MENKDLGFRYKDKVMYLHTHPAMEDALDVDSNHVIIDRHTFDALIDLIDNQEKWRKWNDKKRNKK